MDISIYRKDATTISDIKCRACLTVKRRCSICLISNQVTILHLTEIVILYKIDVSGVMTQNSILHDNFAL